MKDLLEWWEQMDSPQEEPKKVEVEVEVEKKDEPEKTEEDKKTLKALKAATISNLITFTIQQGINKPDGDFDKLKEKLEGYVEMLKSLVKEL